MNAWLGGLQQRKSFKGYGLSELIVALREMAAKVGLKKAGSAGVVKSILAAAKVAIGGHPGPDADVLQDLQGILALARVAAANNAPEGLFKRAQKAMLKVQAALGANMQRAETLMTETFPELERAFPLEGVRVRAVASQHLRSFKNTGAASEVATAIINNPTCARLEIVQAKCTVQDLTSHKQAGSVVIYHNPGTEKLSGKLTELAAFALFEGLSASRTSPLVLSNLLFSSSTSLEEEAARTILQAVGNYARGRWKRPEFNPFKYVLDAAKARTYGYGALKAQDASSSITDIPETRFCLLAPSLVPSSSCAVDFLGQIQMLLPVVQQVASQSPDFLPFTRFELLPKATHVMLCGNKTQILEHLGDEGWFMANLQFSLPMLSDENEPKVFAEVSKILKEQDEEEEEEEKKGKRNKPIEKANVSFKTIERVLRLQGLDLDRRALCAAAIAIGMALETCSTKPTHVDLAKSLAGVDFRPNNGPVVWPCLPGCGLRRSLLTSCLLDTLGAKDLGQLCTLAQHLDLSDEIQNRVGLLEWGQEQDEKEGQGQGPGIGHELVLPLLRHLAPRPERLAVMFENLRPSIATVAEGMRFAPHLSKDALSALLSSSSSSCKMHEGLVRACIMVATDQEKIDLLQPVIEAFTADEALGLLQDLPDDRACRAVASSTFMERWTRLYQTSDRANLWPKVVHYPVGYYALELVPFLELPEGKEEPTPEQVAVAKAIQRTSWPQSNELVAVLDKPCYGAVLEPSKELARRWFAACNQGGIVTEEQAFAFATKPGGSKRHNLLRGHAELVKRKIKISSYDELVRGRMLLEEQARRGLMPAWGPRMVPRTQALRLLPYCTFDPNDKTKIVVPERLVPLKHPFYTQ